MSQRTLHKIAETNGPLGLALAAALLAVACGGSADRSPNVPELPSSGRDVRVLDAAH